MVRHVRGTHATIGIKDGDQDVSKLSPPTGRAVGGVEPRPTAWGGVRRGLAHNTTTPSPHCASLAPWAVGRYFTVRYARGLCVTGFERGDDGISKPPPLTGRGVEARASADGVGRSAPSAGPRTNHAKSDRRQKCALWAVGRGSAGRHGRTFCVAVLKASMSLSNAVPSCCSGPFIAVRQRDSAPDIITT